MGHFLAVTAFKTEESDSVAESINEYSQEFGVKSQILDSLKEPKEDRHALIYSPVNGWCVVLWPNYFNLHDVPVAKAISERLSTTVSTVNVYDGNYWCHVFFNNGIQLDNYCSMPTYWSETEDDAKQKITQYKGHPKAIANQLGIDLTIISGYYTPILEEKNYAKVSPNDEFALDDFWVFTDYWTKLGIQYPKDMLSFKKAINLTKFFSKRLPEGQA